MREEKTMLSGKRALVGDALRQAFMPKSEYERLCEEDKAWPRLYKPLVMLFATILWLAFVVSVYIMLFVVFSPNGQRPFCHSKPILHPLPSIAFRYTEEEAVSYFWVAIFMPTAVLFCISIAYLLAGIAVAYTAPQRHGCLMVVENGCCASKRGGVRCLAVIDGCFAAVFGLLALLLGTVINNLESECSPVLFHCYEITGWSLAVLFGGTAFFLRRKAAVILDEGEHYGNPITGVEMLEAPPELPPSEIQRRLKAGFNSWTGSSFLSLDEEDSYLTSGLDDVFEDDDSYTAPPASDLP